MATDAEVRALIIEPMTGLYSVPHGVNPERALPEYAAALKPYPADALQGAWIATRNNRAKPTWPTIGELVTAARDWIHANVKVEDEQAAEGARDDWKRYPELAAKAMRTERGQQALQAGYGRILHDWVYRHGTFRGFSAEAAAGTDNEVRSVVAELRAAGNRPDLLKLGETLLNREEALCREYLAPVAA